MSKQIDLDFAQRFTCPKCAGRGAEVRRLAMTGAVPCHDPLRPL